MPKAALYCRLSVEDGTGEESESIRNQRILLIAYAQKNGWEIYDVYEDEDYSGLREDRPAFCRLIQDAKNKKFEIILCKTQSRFTRSAATAEIYLHERFPLWGIRFVTVVDGVDTSKKENKKARQINSLVNEWYCEELSENIRSVLRRKMELGQFLGNYAPYGYEKDASDRHHLVVLEAEANVVRYIAKLYLSGLSCKKIADQLTLENIPTPSQGKQKRGQDLGREACNQWGAGTVRKILKNPVYLGHMVQGREQKISYKSKKTMELPKESWIIVKNTHEPIISEKVFVKVQKKLLKNRRGKQSV
ncbi:recombinase family protein [Anaerotignum propionicum]|uniref:Recombinase n=1 Tax=Anaerotignum propionicum DSM 1682 TaxID=991789 RepID=A0A110A6N3_ANAPI|nr:recombinase family protein [Anaerotignum propionicum]AMJ39746.1 recombinase [Anaerotignum propionicum DSM 1682]SHE29159.1 Site-specific DNA recombinase [[Clostridium] propionicum DSM 1682] [Anaerotignum propionicum DSM 1682]